MKLNKDEMEAFLNDVPFYKNKSTSIFCQLVKTPLFDVNIIIGIHIINTYNCN